MADLTISKRVGIIFYDVGQEYGIKANWEANIAEWSGDQILRELNYSEVLKNRRPDIIYDADPNGNPLGKIYLSGIKLVGYFKRVRVEDLTLCGH